MSEGFNDAAKTVMAHKIAGAVDEYLTPFIESIIRQEKAEALRKAAYVAGDECDEKGGNDWFPSEWAGQVSGWLEYRADRIEEDA